MENIKAYIESGILELYVLGELTNDERREVEMMAAKHREVRDEIAEIERSFEGLTDSLAVEPPEFLRNKILSSLETIDTETLPFSGNADSTEQKIVHLQQAEKKFYSFYKYGFAAAVALLILSVVALISLNNKLQESNTQLAILQTANQQFSNTVNFYNSELKERNALINILKTPGTKIVELKGTAKSPNARMSVVFNPQRREVLIDLAELDMPQPNQNQQYQLWALVDGKPVDLGVFDNAKDAEGVRRMKSIGRAQAFAVTLEPRGGSVSPTLEQMVVLGNI